MNNVIIHGPNGDEYNTDAYEYDSELNQFRFHLPKNNNWFIFNDVDITTEVTGFIIEISCISRH